MAFTLKKAASALMTGVIAAVLFVLPVSAQDTNGETFVQTLADEATGILNDESMNDTVLVAEFQNMFIQKTAIRQFGRSALGPYSRVATDEEFDQYIELLEQYATSIVASNLSEYSGERIVVNGSTVEERSSYAYVNVDSDVMSRNGDKIAGVRWLLIRREGEYRLYDITVEAPAEEGTFSLLQMQREEFGSIISNNGDRIRPLLRYLRTRITESGMTPANHASN